MAVNLSPLGAKTLAELFLEQVQALPSGCWIWGGEGRKNGYGHFARGPLALAHRASWLIHIGDIPDGLVVRHKCDVKKCVNPDHLELGTPAQNSKDAKERGLLKMAGAALENTKKTHCTKGHPFDGYNKAAGRYCKQCKREYLRAYYQANKDWLQPYNVKKAREYRAARRAA